MIRTISILCLLLVPLALGCGRPSRYDRAQDQVNSDFATSTDSRLNEIDNDANGGLQLRVPRTRGGGLAAGTAGVTFPLMPSSVASNPGVSPPQLNPVWDQISGQWGYLGYPRSNVGPVHPGGGQQPGVPRAHPSDRQPQQPVHPTPPWEPEPRRRGYGNPPPKPLPAPSPEEVPHVHSGNCCLGIINNNILNVDGSVIGAMVKEAVREALSAEDWFESRTVPVTPDETTASIGCCGNRREF
ncbi:hypothetical protein CL628_02245, partial [bacterium]|nr:hypothetical protein [bacterium]